MSELSDPTVSASAIPHKICNIWKVFSWNAVCILFIGVLALKKTAIASNAATIDFSTIASNALGEWKLGSGCTETANTGPCADQSATGASSIKSVKGQFIDFSAYYNFQCRYTSPPLLSVSLAKATTDRQYGVAAVTALAFKVDQSLNYEDVKSFVIKYTSGAGNTQNVYARIYIASVFNYDGKYLMYCRYKNFRYDVYNGPVLWITPAWAANSVYSTPELVNIVRPFLRRRTEIWRQYFFIITEWLALVETHFSISFSGNPNYYMTYVNKRPAYYLYVDATLGLFAGYPQKYTTSSFIPSMKCLNFWYHMHGNGIGTLSVAIHQSTTLHEEVFRLNGNQSSNWLNAVVPLDNLNSESASFQITFTALRGETTAGDIAIDTITVTTSNCILHPSNGKPPKYNNDSLVTAAALLKLPVPILLLPLDIGLHYLANQSYSLRRVGAPSQYTTDTFGFPLTESYFSGTSPSAIEVLPAGPIKTNLDFTITFHVKPASLKHSKLLWIGNPGLVKDLSISVINTGNISISLTQLSGIFQVTSKVSLAQKIWSYLAFVYSSKNGILKIYSNGEIMEEHKVGLLKQFSFPSTIAVGSSGTFSQNFAGHIACVQLFDEALESHVVKSLKLCVNKHVPSACKSPCKEDGVCDQITGKCLCPPYASRYVLGDCSSALQVTFKGKTSLYSTFDSRIDLRNSLGFGEYHENTIEAKRYITAAVSHQLYFTTPGAVNLAMCTASDQPIRSTAINQGCAVDDSCSSGYSVSLWLSLPSRIELMNITSLDILSLSYIQIQIRSVAGLADGSGLLAINVTSGNQLCNWHVLNCSQGMYGVWKNLVVSVTKPTNEIKVFINGLLCPVSRITCVTIDSPVADIYMGGGSTYICFDDFVIWNYNLAEADAKNLFNAVYYNGYDKSPPKISFSLLSFDDETSFLCALDTNNTIYYYSSSSYWIKLDSGFIHVSVGRNGMWAVDTNNRIHNRMGVSYASPQGTYWNQTDMTTYGSKEILRVQSGFISGIMFAISKTLELLCMTVSYGSVTSMHFWNFYLKDITCFANFCCGSKLDGRTYCFFGISGNCLTVPAAIQVPYQSSQIISDSRNNFFRIFNGDLYRANSVPHEWIKMEENSKFSYVIGINGQPVAVTTSGELKMVGHGENTFKIFHSGGLCLQQKSPASNNVMLGEKCAFFELEKDDCWKDTSQQTYLKPGALNVLLNYSATCVPNTLRRHSLDLILVVGIGFLTPYANQATPNTTLISRKLSSPNFRYFQFYFEQASAFKRINSFYPKRKAQGTANSELKFEITIMFRVRDMKFVENFRDLHGTEATLVYTLVRQELDQIFTESNHYVKSKFGEIRQKRELITWCTKDSICNTPLEIQFNGYIWLSFLTNYEMTILLSGKFNGEETYCNNHICSFTLSEKARGGLTSKPNIQLIKSTSSSLVFQYVPPKYQGMHTGYKISYVAERRLQPGVLYFRNLTLQDGLIFTIPSLFPYAMYNLTIEPLEPQNTAQSPFVIQSSTTEKAPTQSPKIRLQGSYKFSCEIKISDLSSALEWNGISLGYVVFYERRAKLSDELFGNFDMEKASSFQARHVPHENWSVWLSNLRVFTNYVVYIGARNSAGVGPVSRLVFRTKPGAPERSPENFKVTQLDPTFVTVTWKALANNSGIWNSNEKDWLGYELRFREISIPPLTPDAANASVVFCNGSETTSQVIGPLAESREYMFEIAAKNSFGITEHFTKICFLMKEGVPSAAPRILTAIHISSSSLSITTGDISLEDEKGAVVYYNVSVTAKATEAKDTRNTRYYQMRVADSGVISTDFESDSLCRTADKSRAVENEAYVCPNNSRTLDVTSSVITATIPNLIYWTEYELEVSGCTCKGCGVFSPPITARTDEHTPTCSPTKLETQSRTSVSLNLAWSQPLVSCMHGVLTRYRVYFGPKQDFTNRLGRLKDWRPLAEGERSDYYYSDLKALYSFFPNLKKYSEYCCVVAAATSKGFGPVSSPLCVSTLEDRPDGPPTSVKGLVMVDGIEISLQPPQKEVANGIIREYTIFYAENSTDVVVEQNVTVERNLTTNEIVTLKLVKGLKPFHWYKFQTVAATHVGSSVIRSEPIVVRSQEAAPSAAPRNISAQNLTKNSADLVWLQLPEAYMNGVFRKFKLIINETLADNSQGVLRTVYIFPGKKPLSQVQVNAETEDENRTKNASSQAQLSPVIDVSVDVKGDVGCIIDEVTGTFLLSLIGLRPYTTYTASLVACTNAGCGVSDEITFMTLEFAPSASPVIKLASESTEIQISWNDIPILQRNGKLTNVTIRWIKLCYFPGRENKLSIPADCSRVFPSNSSDFSQKSVSERLHHTMLSELTPYTFYIVFVAVETLEGPGPEATAVIRTKESTPVKAPEITQAYNTSGRSIKLKWKDIPLPFQNGILIGYTITFQRVEQLDNVTAAEQHLNCSVGLHGYTEYELKNLDLYTEYNISIAGFTSEGIGVSDNEITVRTGPYVHGGWSEWSKWNFCTKNCGGGTQERKRSCTNPSPWNGGDDCKGEKKESQICNTKRCSGIFASQVGDDCLLTCTRLGFVCMPNIDLKNTFSKYKELGLDCKDTSSAGDWKEDYHPSYANNTGLCAGFKNIKTPIACNATPPNDGYTQRLCNCLDPADVGFTEWAPWSLCSKKCGGGVRRSKRECLVPGVCVGNTTQFLDCNTKPCPVDGAWGQWSSYTPCNKSCGSGYRHRYRKCDSPPMESGGSDCPGSSVDEVGECNAHLCPVNGGWSNWEGNRICNQPCGGGLSIQRRYCDNPKPLFDGKNCIGEDIHTTPCNQHKCRGVEVLFWFRLLDFEWDFVYYSMSSPASQRVAASCRDNLKAVYNDASFLTAVFVKEIRNTLPSEAFQRRRRRAVEQTYVVANVDVFYSAVKQTEVLYLQDYVTATGKLHNLTIASTAVEPVTVLSGPPRNVTAKGLDPHTIQITWKAPINITSVTNVSNYYIFYRKESSTIGRWEVRGVPLDLRVFNITRLDPVTKYRIRMTVSVEFGNGPASGEISETTPEGVPNIPPGNLSLQSTQPTEMYVQWDPIPYKEFLGMPLGYIVQYKLYQESSFSAKKVAYGLSAVTLSNLKPYSLYIVQVYGYTGTGDGPPSAAVGKTLEGVPSIPPPDVTVTQFVSMNSIIVRWNAISDEETNGRFEGYKIKYTAVKVSGKDTPGTPTAKYIEVDKYTFIFKITGLQSYTTYSVSVLGYTKAGDGPLSAPINADTCKCPDNIFFNWYENSPYLTKDQDGNIGGIFKELIDEMVTKSCGTCNNKGSVLNWQISLTGDNPQKRSEIDVKKAIGQDYHISCPVFGRSEITRYAQSHVFISLVNSPGSAMLVRNEVDYLAKTLNTLKSMLSVWPMLVIIVLFSFIFGILLWSAEQFANEEFARGSFFQGSCTGFWWAYISMTTVGYGDITPRTVLGRSFAICWTLVGLVLMGIITGALTSSITSKTIPVELKLYGSTAAVINKSYEYSLAVRRNSKVYAGSKIVNANDVLWVLKNKKVNIALLDAFVVASQRSKITDMHLKVKKLIEGNSGYGVVLSNELTLLEDDFRSFVVTKQQIISNIVKNMTDQIQVSTEKTPDVMLFDPSTPAFWLILKAELILLVILIVLGSLHTLYTYLRGRGNKITSDSHEDRMVSFVDSFEENLEQFEQKVTKRAQDFKTHHENEIQELLLLKRNLRRYERRMSRRGELLDVSRRTSYSNEALVLNSKRRSKKYQPTEGGWNNDTDC